MLKAENDVFGRNSSLQQVVGDALFCPIFFDPNFTVFHAEINYHSKISLFAIPANSKPEVMIAFYIEGNAFLNANLV